MEGSESFIQLNDAIGVVALEVLVMKVVREAMCLQRFVLPYNDFLES